MKKTGNNSLLKVSVIILIGLNLIVLMMFWSSKKPKQRKMSGDPIEMLIKNVGFNEKQSDSFKTLVDENRKERRQISNKIRKVRKELFSLIGSEKKNREILLKEVSELESKEALSLFQHFEEVYLICDTDAQRKELKRMILETVTKMGGTRQGGGGPPMRHPPRPGQGPPKRGPQNN